VHPDHPSRLLVVDDDPQLARALRISLTARGYEVAVVASGGSALAAATARVPDLVILDLGLPDMDGRDVLAALRRWTEVPVMILSGRGDPGEKVDILDAGADDYVTKPFSPDELAARIRALLRRTELPDPQRQADPPVTIGHYAVDLAAKSITRSGAAPEEVPEHVRLTKTEWAVLEVLVRNAGRLVTRRELLQQVWGPAYYKENGYLRFYVTRLRKKLESDPHQPRYLLTEAGVGYRFQP
jgi:two-component system, OmpR family, KDP operon response regulator KdpE